MIVASRPIALSLSFALFSAVAALADSPAVSVHAADLGGKPVVVEAKESRADTAKAVIAEAGQLALGRIAEDIRVEDESEAIAKLAAAGCFGENRDLSANPLVEVEKGIAARGIARMRMAAGRIRDQKLLSDADLRSQATEILRARGDATDEQSVTTGLARMLLERETERWKLEQMQQSLAIADPELKEETFKEIARQQARMSNLKNWEIGLGAPWTDWSLWSTAP